jgi:dihydrofolate reductase
MRKVILFNLATLDGFFAGPDGEIDWHNVDEEFNEFAIQQLESADGLIFGRLTYQMMAGYWPTPDAVRDDPVVAGKMNSIQKYVFTRTLNQAGWNNTRLGSSDAAEELARLKQQPGRDLFVFGSADLAATFIEHDLIDEFRIIVNPVVLGRGKPLFKDLQRPLKLKLLKTQPFRNGNILLYYQRSV